MTNKKRNGFTLIEMVMVILLLGIITVTASRMVGMGLTGYLTSKNVTSADWQGLIALERMTYDLLTIRSSLDISTATGSAFTFVNIDGETISYSLSGSSLLRNSQILADGVNSLTFTYYDTNGSVTSTLTAIRFVKIALNITQSGANFNLFTSIFPRNLF